MMKKVWYLTLALMFMLSSNVSFARMEKEGTGSLQRHLEVTPPEGWFKSPPLDKGLFDACTAYARQDESVLLLACPAAVLQKCRLRKARKAVHLHTVRGFSTVFHKQRAFGFKRILFRDDQDRFRRSAFRKAFTQQRRFARAGAAEDQLQHFSSPFFRLELILLLF